MSDYPTITADTGRGTLGHLILSALNAPEGSGAPLATVQLLAMPVHPENTRSILNYYAEGGEVRITDDRYHLTRYGLRLLEQLGEYRYER